MIAELQMPMSIQHQPTTSPIISTQEHIRSWRKQKEKTASDSITGLSFSHYIAGTYDPNIAEFDAIMRSLPYQHGFSPTNWQTISDVEILKKAGEYDIGKNENNYPHELRIKHQQQETGQRHDEQS